VGRGDTGGEGWEEAVPTHSDGLSWCTSAPQSTAPLPEHCASPCRNPATAHCSCPCPCCLPLAATPPQVDAHIDEVGQRLADLHPN